MSSSLIDPLYTIFKQALETSGVLYESEDEFVAHVVDCYVESLSPSKRLPLAYLDEFREDIANEVYEMLLKTTYGHFSFGAYKNSKLKST